MKKQPATSTVAVMANGTSRIGVFASSPSEAAASNPMKVRTPNTRPWLRPLKPAWPISNGTGVNGRAETMTTARMITRLTEKNSIASISRVDSLMSRSVMNHTRKPQATA